MRKAAHAKGFILNEYSLRKLSPNGLPGKPLQISSEEDIFKQLGMEYKEPRERHYF
jgi:DNA polymerase/3'-5' exonuclease PolX